MPSPNIFGPLNHCQKVSNNTITNCRPTHGTVRKSDTILKVRQLKKSNQFPLIAKSLCVKRGRDSGKTAQMLIFTGFFESSLLIYAVLPKFGAGTYLICIALACVSY